MNTKWVHRAVLLAVLGMSFPVASFAGFFNVGITVGFAPPALPVYVQPPCPAPGYLWTPGFWAYSDDDGDYYWVPGTWVAAPSPGLLWTPGFWAAADDEYVWHPGYWAPHIGFYGGINYGFGYFGVGYSGGYWRGRDFFYNRAVSNITNLSITNVYNRTVINNYHDGTRASFNGGNGIQARPTRGEMIAEREPHRGFTQPQRLQAESALRMPSLLASVNHGRPAIAATARPGDFRARAVVPARDVNSSPSNSSAPRERTAGLAHSVSTAPPTTATPRFNAVQRAIAAQQFTPTPRVAVAPRHTFAPSNVVPARSVAPAPSTWHAVSQARAPAAQWSAPTYRPASQNIQSPGARFNQGYAAQPRNEAPRPMQVPRGVSPPPSVSMQRDASPPRLPGPAPIHDRRRS
ncbi:MAG TPA: hypothetical protein VKP66_04535 [Steroidobacteraceae bacterium]|nr:hypothetical protein [Steroidobacteraceae bacterium]